jgi:hypothetical protein
MKGTLVGLTATELTTLRASALACIVAGTVRGTSYSIAGRTFSFPTLEAAQDLLSESNYALGLLNGTRSANVRANFNPGLGRGVVY